MAAIYLPIFIGCFFLVFLSTVIAEKKMIPILRAKAAQPIYEFGPAWHAKKSGTPTMGGLGFLISLLISFLPLCLILYLRSEYESSLSLSLTVLYAFLNACIGVKDDLKKLENKKNEGLTPKQKLIRQFLLAGLYLFSRFALLSEGTQIFFSFGMIDLGWLYYPLALVLLVGIVNCANLTDGIDGLASSVAFGIGLSLCYVSSFSSVEGTYLGVMLLGCAVGFLCFNLNPARIFMGDTGSLFFGACVAGSGFALHNPLLLFFFGAVYIIEGVSVVIQVLVYKMTKKRVFLMAPLHHHFEKLGWSENRICLCAIFLTLLFALPVYFLCP